MKNVDFFVSGVADVNDHWRVVPLEAAGPVGEGGSKSAAAAGGGPSHGPETKHKSEVMLVQMRKKGNHQVSLYKINFYH